MDNLQTQSLESNNQIIINFVAASIVSSSHKLLYHLYPRKIQKYSSYTVIQYEFRRNEIS